MNLNLESIENDFCDDLDKEGFFLSNLVSKASSLPSFVNGMLLTALMASSLAPAVQAHELPNGGIVQEGVELSIGDRYDTQNQLAEKYHENAEVMTDSIIMEIANGERSGAFTLPSTGEIVFVYQKDVIELGSGMDEHQLEALVKEHFEVFNDAQFSVASSSSAAVKHGGFDFNLLKVGFGDYSKHIDGFAESYPTMAKYESLIITLHEIVHAEMSMTGVTEASGLPSLGGMETLLVNEGLGTLYSVLAAPKVDKEMSNEEAFNLLVEHAAQRTAASEKMDAGHNASYVLENVIEAVRVKPELMGQFRNMSHSELLSFSESVVRSATEDLALNSPLGTSAFIEGGSRAERDVIEQDARYYAEHGEMSSEHALANVLNFGATAKYEAGVKALGESMAEGGSFKDAYRKTRTEDGDRAIGEALNAFVMLNSQSQLNDAIQSYDVNSPTAVEMVSNALNNVAQARAEVENVHQHEQQVNYLDGGIQYNQ